MAHGLPRWQASVRRRLVVLVVVVTGSAVVALTLVVQALLAWTTRDSADTALAERAQAVAAATKAGQGSLSTPVTLLDSGVAVFDESGRLVAGSVPTALTDEYSALAGATRAQARTVRGDQRLYALPFSARGRPAGTQSRRGVVVVVERLAPYEETEAVALLVSVAAGLLLVMVATALTAWVSRRALAPVSAMAATAEEWSEHDLDQRFGLGLPRDEITSLGQTLDRLLEKVAGRSAPSSG
ncbi:MAG: HAMP domain-containing protein [Nocardioides sp.]